ncbi:HNH endonuclease signature motif containing protein [Demequina sp. SYSU T00192]|uniref:HNH endonuclease signature motif containing protein n=1 Tax=Demequina litoralis TaxID=3051660 RepID=A0ABT8GBV1_9MICO|nr:HNH endonuclease signature motif containing protein [Demequina sp. SYSU T00192]MDN4476616.1 HNH endonuclease signature motif containing protein [Demequina sp. SYSU T00192]
MPWEKTTVSARASRLPADWRRRRVLVLKRDGYACQMRTSTGALCRDHANQVDHIIRGDNHDLSNLRALCVWHHARKTSAEGNAARRPRPTRKRAPEAHPGLL